MPAAKTPQKWSGIFTPKQKSDKPAETVQSRSQALLGQALRSNAPGAWSDNRLEQSQHLVGVAFVAIKVLAEQAMAAECKVLQSHPEQKTGTELPATHPLVSLLERPNPKEMGGLLRYRLVQQLSLTGTALQWKVANGFGVPQELWCIPTCTAQPMPTAAPQFPGGAYRIMPLQPYGPFAMFPALNTAAGCTIPADEMVRTIYPHPFISYEGYSPQTAARLQLDAIQQIDRSRWYAMKQGVNPSAVLELDPEYLKNIPDEPEMDRLKAEFAANYGGPENSGKIAILTPGAALKPYSTAPSEMGWDTSWSQLTDFALAVWGVTKGMARMSEDESYAALYARLKQFNLFTLCPLLTLLAHSLTIGVAHLFDKSFYVELHPKSIEDKDENNATVTTLVTFGGGTNNECRKLLGLEPTKEPWGEERCSPAKSPGGDKPGQPGQPGAPGTALTPPQDPAEAARPDNPAGEGSLGARVAPAAGKSFDPQQHPRAGNGEFGSGGGSAGGGEGATKKPRRAKVTETSPAHIKRAAEDTVATHYSVQTGLLAKMAKGEYDAADVVTDSQAYAEKATAANASKFKEHYQALRGMAEQYFGADALKSPEWAGVKEAFVKGRDAVASAMNDMHETVLAVAESCRDHPDKPQKAGSGDREQLSYERSKAKDAAKAAADGVFSAWNAFAKVNKPVGKGGKVFRAWTKSAQSAMSGGLGADLVPPAEFALRKLVNEAAAETETAPTEAQKKSGKYRKGVVNLHGLQIAIENARGSIRSGVSADGTPWSTRMAHHYGYIRNAAKSDADGDHVDVFIGPFPESQLVFVVDQVGAEGLFDEHKCMLGFLNEASARQGYLDCYSPGWTGLGDISAMSLPDFKAWLKDGDTAEPVGLGGPKSTGRPSQAIQETCKRLYRRLQDGEDLDEATIAQELHGSILEHYQHGAARATKRLAVSGYQTKGIGDVLGRWAGAAADTVARLARRVAGSILGAFGAGGSDDETLATIADDAAYGAQHAGRVDASAAAGVSALRWKSQPGSCAFCRQLDGVEVAPGETWTATSSSGKTYEIPHPPAHDSCRCDVDEVEDDGLSSRRAKAWRTSGRKVQDASGHEHAADGRFGSGGSHAGGGEKPKPSAVGHEESKTAQGKPKGAIASISAVLSAGQAKLTGAGKAVYDKLPGPAKKVVDWGVAIEHKAVAAYKSGQDLAVAVAHERGLPPEHAERVGRILARVDGIARWTGNIPIAHGALEHGLHAVAHALGEHAVEALAAVGGPVAVGAFLGAKVAFYLPVASLSYVGYSMGREALSGKNPVELIKKARARVKASKGSGAEHKSYKGQESDEGNDFTAELLEWFAGIPAEQHDWAEALLSAAIDETHGDQAEALDRAKAELDGDEEEQVGETKGGFGEVKVRDASGHEHATDGRFGSGSGHASEKKPKAKAKPKDLPPGAKPLGDGRVLYSKVTAPTPASTGLSPERVQQIGTSIKDAYEESCLYKQYEDGVVDTARLFDVVRDTNPNLTVPEFQAVLGQMWNDKKVEWKVANEERTVEKLDPHHTALNLGDGVDNYNCHFYVRMRQ